MSDRPFFNMPAAVLLREMHDGGMSYRVLGDRIGYHWSTIYNVAQGRDRAGPSLVRDVESMHKQWAKGRATA